MIITNSAVCPSPSWTKSYFVTMQSSSAMWTLPCKDNLWWKKNYESCYMSEPSKKIKGDYRNNAILNFISRAFIINLFLKLISPTVIFIVLIINHWVRAGRKNISTRSSLRGSQSSLSYALISIWPIMLINWAARLLSLIHIWRCRRSTLCRSRWSPYH